LCGPTAGLLCYDVANMRSISFTATWVGTLIASASLLACGSSTPSSNDAGTSNNTGPVSFKNDLLTATPTGFEFSCGLSSSCHHDAVKNPKTDRVFLGCNQKNMTCTFSGDVATAVYQGLVGSPDAGGPVMSQELPTMAYVKPGDPDNSYLVRKLEGTLSSLQCVPISMDPIAANAASEPVSPTPPCGTQMPLTADPIPALNMKVRQWIMQGALFN
jgi:hypothetical protein